MEIAWILTVLFIFITLVFAVFAIFFPEWVGITGKKAREIQEEHRGEKPPSQN